MSSSLGTGLALHLMALAEAGGGGPWLIPWPRSCCANSSVTTTKQIQQPVRPSNSISQEGGFIDCVVRPGANPVPTLSEIPCWTRLFYLFVRARLPTDNGPWHRQARS